VFRYRNANKHPFLLVTQGFYFSLGREEFLIFAIVEHHPVSLTMAKVDTKFEQRPTIGKTKKVPTCLVEVFYGFHTVVELTELRLP